MRAAAAAATDEFDFHFFFLLRVAIPIFIVLISKMPGTLSSKRIHKTSTQNEKEKTESVCEQGKLY